MRIEFFTAATMCAVAFVANVVQAQYPVPSSYPVPVESMPAEGFVVGGESGPVAVGGPVPYAENYGSGPVGLGYPGVVSNGGGDQLYPYDQQDPWLHGYFQEIPAYGGYGHFRPYNYKHVLSQSQTAGGWGMTPQMPYSQQFWHRYHERASLMQELGRVQATEYAKELARHRARRDFERLQTRQPAQPRPQTVQPELRTPPSRNVVVGYEAQPRTRPESTNDDEVERLKWQIDEQRARIRDLQRQLERTNGRGFDPRR